MKTAKEICEEKEQDRIDNLKAKEVYILNQIRDNKAIYAK